MLANNALDSGRNALDSEHDAPDSEHDVQGVDRDVLLRALADELEPQRFQDYCPNGLQVEGKQHVRRVVSGVTASAALIEAAIRCNADLLLVHHGYFWRGEDPTVTGMKRRRLQMLLQHDLNLVAYHLPLDAHPRLGNNAQLAQRLHFQVDGPLRDDGVGFVGQMLDPCAPEVLCERLADVLGREPLWIAGGGARIERVAWCTGGAQSLLSQAAALGVDAYISGEISEQTTHEARELGLHYFAAGHHATERYGPEALGAWCAQQFGLWHRFIEIPNPA